LSVQLWAGVIALANGLHGTALSGTLGALYTNAGGIPSLAPYINNYRDITSGQAGSFSAGPGWDFVTGLGSPLANTLVNALIGPSSSPDFSLSISGASTQTVTRGSPASYTVAVTPSGGFTSTVTFSVSGLPAGASAAFSPPSVTGSGSSTLKVTTSTTTPTGTYTLTITGTSGSSLTHSTTVTMVVNSAAPDFTIVASPGSRTVTRGTVTTYTVTVAAVNGFSGPVNLTAGSSPAGVTLSFNPTSVNGSGSSTMTVTTSGSMLPGTYTLGVTGTSGALVHSTSVTLVVRTRSH
jgi:hypothetical protein